jgi:hypothetical protein
MDEYGLGEACVEGAEPHTGINGKRLPGRVVS